MPPYDDDWDETPTAPCPYCRREIAEDTPRCPHCERYLSTEDSDGDPEASAAEGKPWWIYVGVGVCLVIVYFWIVR